MNDIFIRPLRLPSKVHAVTVTDRDGNFNIYVNDSICEASQKRAYNHEMKHILLNHFSDYHPVIVNELQAESENINNEVLLALT